MSFVASEAIQREAMAECVKLCKYVAETFKLQLDWTDQSIEKIEDLLGFFHREAQKDKPSDADVAMFSKGFGSYIGEVYRRNHGASWGTVTLGDEGHYGLQAAGSGIQFWPWGRAQQRILHGPTANVWDYYQELLRRGATAGKAPAPARPWWKSLFKRF